MTTYTELKLTPFNNRRLMRINTIQGDFNLINPVMKSYLKSLDRKKESYCFEVKDEQGNTNYQFNLKNSEFESFKKHIPNINITTNR